MIQPTDYEFAPANTSNAEIVRRFLAKAHGDEHPAMEAFYNVWRASQPYLIRSLSLGRHPADASHLPRKTTAAPATLHGDFGAMEFTEKHDLTSLSHWGLVCSD